MTGVQTCALPIYESEDTDETKYLPVEDNPKHENQENREFWNNILWDLVEKRQ